MHNKTKTKTGVPMCIHTVKDAYYNLLLIVSGDPEDRTLRIVEEDTLVGNVMRERGRIICEKEMLGINVK